MGGTMKTVTLKIQHFDPEKGPEFEASFCFVQELVRITERLALPPIKCVCLLHTSKRKMPVLTIKEVNSNFRSEMPI
jgi:hypothetical protein